MNIDNIGVKVVVIISKLLILSFVKTKLKISSKTGTISYVKN